jgi:hypothetical protein
MSNLKDVMFAINGETEEKVKPQEDYIPEAKAKNVIKGADDELNKMVVFKLVNKNTSGVYIQPIDYVINPKEPELGLQMIRLLEGVSTIWAKDQKGIPENRIGQLIKNMTLEWPRGSRFMYVPAFDKAKLEFMEVCNHNRLNEHRTKTSKTEFFKYDAEDVEKAKTAIIMKEIELLMKAQKQPFEKMKQHAFYLGIRLTHDITGAPKSEDALRGEYLLKAKTSPEEFEKSFDKKEVDIHYKIRQAIVDGKLDIARGDGRIYYGKNGALVCNLPNGQDPIRYLTELALTNSKEGKDFKTELERIVT